MTDKTIPTPEELRKLLRYEPETGKLFWLPRPKSSFSSFRAYRAWTSRDEGKEALTGSNVDGYKTGTIRYYPCLAHRVIWAIQTGEWPDKEIDHINGDKADNRWENLRNVTHLDNGKNLGISVRNKSGKKGVSWHKGKRMWVANIRVNYKQHHLGYFNDVESAAKAYESAEKIHFGEFARMR